MRILTDTIYIHYSKRAKSFYLLEPELLVDFKDVEALVLKLVDSMNRMRSIRRFNYTPFIYICFILSILSTILVYYYGYLTIAALVLLAFTILFIVLKFLKGRAVDKELSNVVFEYLEELREKFEIKIKSSEFFMEFKKSPAIILKPRNPFNEIFKSGDLNFIIDDKSHLSMSFSINQKELASKGLAHFFNQANEKGMIISTKKKAELYKFVKSKTDEQGLDGVPENKNNNVNTKPNIGSPGAKADEPNQDFNKYTTDPARTSVQRDLNN